MWGNLGVSLFGPLTGALVAMTVGSLWGAVGAIIVGCLIGGLLLAGSACFGAVTGAPSMVSLRGLLGRRASTVPTALNIFQNIGWATMEIIVIATTAAYILGPQWRLPFVIIGGVLATLMAIRPLGTVRLLRKIMIWLVLACSVYLFVQVLMQPATPIDASAASGFWPGVDLAVAGVVSFAPLAADYARHSRTRLAAAGGAGIGYGLAAIGYYTLGVFAVVHLPGAADGDRLIGALVALPAGGIALAILMIDEVDEAFANIYSTTMSVQNLVGRADRRVVAVGVGLLAMLLAALLDFGQYQSFLYLIGSVFVPLFSVAAADFFWISRQRWDVSDRAPFRLAPVLAWACGFVAYQLIYPGDVPGWSALWTSVRDAIGFTAPSWLGSSVGAIVVSIGAMVILGSLSRALARR